MITPYDLVSCERAAQRIHDLIDRGYTATDIAAASGVRLASIQTVKRREGRICFQNEAAILTLDLDEYSPRYRVPVDLALPLIHKLLDDGWSQKLIASTIGMTDKKLNLIIKGTYATIPRQVFDTLTQLVPPKDEPFHGECTYADCTQPAEDNELRQCAEHARKSYAVLKWELPNREEVPAQ